VIEVVVLGTAAGGGFPQWNCQCQNCRAVREGELGLIPRLQSSLAIRGRAGPWHLVNTSPDLACQVERYLQCDGEVVDRSSMRASPIASVLLTNADLDHCLGLFTLREGNELRVTAPDGVRASLIRDLHMDAVLGRYNGIRWAFASDDWMPVDQSGLEARVLPLSHAEPPKYDLHSAEEERARCHGVGYQFRHRDHEGVIGVFPDVGWMDQDLLGRLGECHTIFFDGTFWIDDEMAALGLGTRSARDMGHIPMHGSGGSIEALSELTDTQVYFVHINNTNPVLRPQSPERAALELAGMHVAEDGMRMRWSADHADFEIMPLADPGRFAV